MNRKQLGEWVFGLSWVCFVIFLFRLGDGRFLYHRDAFHLFLGLQWAGYLMGGERFGGLALWKGAAQLGPRIFVSLYISWSLLWGWAGILRHWAFYTDDFDLGIFGQVLKSLGEGKGYYQLVDVDPSYFAIHQNYTLPLLTPLMWFDSGTELMLLTQAFCLFLPGLLLALWVRRHWPVDRESWAWVVFGCWMLAAPVIKNNLHDFHETLFSAPLLVLWGWAFLERRTKTFLVAGLLAGMTKENLLIVTLPGILLFPYQYGMLRDRRFLVFLGMCVVQVGLFGFQQAFVSELNFATQRYAHLGSTWYEVLITVLTKPEVTLGLVLHPEKRAFFFELLWLNGFSSLFAGVLTLAWMPMLVLHTVTNEGKHFFMGYHYVLEVWPVAFMAGVAFWKGFLTTRPKQSFALAAVMVTAFTWNLQDNPLETIRRYEGEVAHNRPLRQGVREKLRAMEARCGGDLLGVADYRIFAQVFEFGTVYPYREWKRFVTRDRYERLSRDRCVFFLGKSHQIDAWKRGLSGEFELVHEGKSFEGDTYELLARPE